MLVTSLAPMGTTRTETITAEDGGTFNAHLRIPDKGSGPGLVLIQEVGGVNGYIKTVADRLAEAGYVSLAPDMFWRIEPNFVVESFTEEGMAECMRVARQFDPEAGRSDLNRVLEHLRQLPEVEGGVGAIGFCFGGTQAFLMAADHDLDVAVSYYGSGVAGLLDRVGDIAGPLLLHFGGDDPFIPADQLDAIAAATNPKANIEMMVQPDAGHAFDNHRSERYYDADAANAAWTRTIGFLAKHLPVKP